MDTITIRPARADDAETIYLCICVLEDYKADQFDLFRQCFEANLPDANKLHLVAQLSSNKVVGYLSCYGQLLLHHLGMVYEIQEMFVEDDFRGHGIGKHMLAALDNMLASRPHVSVEVTSNKLRASALRFYEQNGFVQTHAKLVKEQHNQ